MAAFWMVYGEGQRGPTFKHMSSDEARREAERLAGACPGVKFFVLEATGFAQKVDVVFQTLDDIPF